MPRLASANTRLASGTTKVGLIRPEVLSSKTAVASSQFGLASVQPSVASTKSKLPSSYADAVSPGQHNIATHLRWWGCLAMLHCQGALSNRTVAIAFHKAQYPYHTKTRVKLVLKASGRQDAVLLPKPGKSPVLITNLVDLYDLLSGQGPEAESIKDLAIIAFWGMARIGELTHCSNRGRISYRTEPTSRDVKNLTHVTVIEIHQAKTAKPGKIQFIKLRPMNSPLCPVKAITRRLRATSTGTDSLLGHDQNATRVNLTKRRANEVLSAAWQHLGKPKLSGHLFRVVGASLRNTTGISIDQIKSLGRWTSDCYQRYIKPLSQTNLINSLAILE
ncbi:hypothetical protein PCANC_15977 [Puccinia coronata f. sp. avenae]|uniref:Tyr recombinase domain-containing protein n=1 Tax=Puccinia coronata f. sp. avenae TaxID=200324 RepID=A0A2N5SMF7_9BASI|nr:hypothetical protein PCANC_15977 [Puccinia coronata f. sp. avenae]